MDTQQHSDLNPIVEESTVSMWPDVIRYGLIGGLVLIIYSLCIIAFDLMTSSLIMASLLGIFTFLLFIPFMTIAVINHRNNSLGGFISFGRAFLIGLLVAMFMTVLHQIFSFIYNIIDPGYIENIQEFMVNALEEMGAPADQIEQVESDFENAASIGNIVKNALFFLVFGTVVSLISAAILKKNKDEKETTA